MIATAARTSADELNYMSAAELAERIRTSDVSPVEVVRAVLDRIAATQPHYNAFLAVPADAALAAARAAEQAVASGEPLPPLHGVPFSVKDILNTEGVATTWGSHLMADNVPGADNVAVARLKAAGAILIGKTTTPEFAHKQVTDAPLFGKTHNPWRLDRTPGGSSGGSAVAVAAGMGPLSLATDAGGSTRLPAACTGVVGFKPTLGLVPHNQVPDAFGSFIHLGTVARTVADTALMLAVLAGEDARDPISLGKASDDFRARARPGGDLSGRRFAWTLRFGNEAVDPEVVALCERTVEALAALGAEVVPFEEEVENSEPVWRVLQYTNWLVRFRDTLDQNRARMDPSLVAGIEEARAYTAFDFQRATYRRTALFRTVQGWFERFDALLMPTMSRPAISVDHDVADPIEVDGRRAGDLRLAWSPYLNPFNLTGHPSVSVPAGWTREGLPVGLQIVGRYLGDSEMLRIAAELEAAQPWTDRRPPPL